MPQILGAPISCMTTLLLDVHPPFTPCSLKFKLSIPESRQFQTVAYTTAFSLFDLIIRLTRTLTWQETCFATRMTQKLLLIDENSQLLTLVGDYLSKLGYEVHRASESDEAEALLKNYEYSVVITGTDWKEFGNTGRTLTQCIKCLVHRPRIILLKEFEASSPAASLSDDEAILVAEKPVSLLRLGDLVQEIPIS